jgi:hypothetical protein
MNEVISCRGCFQTGIKAERSTLCIECHRKIKAEQVRKSKLKMKEAGPARLRAAEKRQAVLEELSNRYLRIKLL